MSDGVERIEVYLDREDVPFRVLEAPPFDLSLDASRLADGDHALRIVSLLRDGRRLERTIPFRVDNFPHLAVAGLEEGMVVRGAVDLSIRVGERPPMAARRGLVAYLAPAFVVFGAVWAFFAFVAPPFTPPPTGERPSPAGGEAAAASLMAEGASLYEQNCASCHQKNGQGVPGAFPPLAGDTSLKDAALVVHTMHSGHSGAITVNGKRFDATMPAIGAGFDSGQLAAVATYVRNSWGNAFGPVTPRQASDILSSASGR